MSDVRDTGAIDWLLVQSQGKEMSGELVPPLLDLVDRRLVRILGALEGVSSGLLSDEDAAAAAAALDALDT